MKQKICKALAFVLVFAMAFGCGIMVNASTNKGDTDKKVTPVVNDTSKDIKNTDLSSLIDTAEAGKQETVYVIAGADGSVKKVIVSELLKNTDGKNELKDVTDLKDIENVKSDATYTMDNKSCIWDANGEDIYYQGTTDKEVPVTFKISFKLDGKEVTTDELAGASGKVEMTFTYTNTQKQTVEIDGKDEEIYVPFLMLSGMILDNENFKNVTVDNGKVISDGDKSVVVGYAVPGMQENLGVDKDTLSIPSGFTISADVTDFALSTTLTVATNDIFNHVDLSNVDSIDDLKTQLATLDSATLQLMDGSSQLYNGLTTLLEKSKELVTGINTLATGAAKLKTGADTLYSGTQLFNTKLTELNTGLTTLSGKSTQLDGGAKQVFTTLLTTVKTQLDAAGLDSFGITVPELTIENYSTVLTGLVNTLTEENAKKAVLQGVLTSKGYTVQQYATNPAVKSGIDAYMASAEGQALVTNAVTKASAGRTQITGAKAQLDSYNQFYTGLIQYTTGVDTAAAGSTALLGKFGDIVEGSKQISENLGTLVDGINLLVSKTPELTDGVTKLQTGAGTLKDGLNTYYETGIKKLVDAVKDYAPIFSRLKATLDVSKDYQSFGGIAEGTTGNVKFIYRTEAIK